MKTPLKLIAAALLLAAPGLAFAQTEPQPEAEGQAEAQATPPEPMQMMMQMMQNCMGMMQMMQGAMGREMPMQGGMMQGGEGMMQGGEAGPMHGHMSEATRAYMAAMSRMDMPMMQGIQSDDPDIAFVKGMIAHHRAPSICRRRCSSTAPTKR